MSFAKPNTPTKNRLIAREVTASERKSLSNTSLSNSHSSINLSNSHQILDEINLLLHLETFKRNRDYEIFLKQKVEEAYKQFEERRNKFCSLVAKYAQLVKLANTRKVLLRNNIELPIELARADAKSIKEKLSSGVATDYINTTELNKFKEMLHQTEKYKNLPIKRLELVDLQNSMEAIQYSIEAIEKSLENCTIQGLDYFTDTLDMENYPKLLKENENKIY